MGAEFIRININQNESELCGYSYDIELNNKKSYCQAYFSGYYNKEKELGKISGEKFIVNSGDHILMNIVFWRVPQTDKKIMRASVSSKSILDDIVSENNFFWLKKVSNFPLKPANNYAVCLNNINAIKTLPKNQKTNNPTVKKDSSQSLATKEKEKKLVPIIDTVSFVSKISEPNKIEDSIITPSLLLRKNSLLSSLVINDKRIKISLFDNGEIDNDSVSIFYNKKLICSNKRLTDKPIDLIIDIDENITDHDITICAQNLGEIAPNTAVIIVTSGKKRFELHSSCSLNENAVLHLIYKPDNN